MNKRKVEINYCLGASFPDLSNKVPGRSVRDADLCVVRDAHPSPLQENVLPNSGLFLHVPVCDLWFEVFTALLPSFNYFILIIFIDVNCIWLENTTFLCVFSSWESIWR